MRQVLALSLLWAGLFACERPRTSEGALMVALFLGNGYRPAPEIWLTVEKNGTAAPLPWSRPVTVPIGQEGVARLVLAVAAGELAAMEVRGGRHVALVLPGTWRISEGPYAGTDLPTASIFGGDTDLPALLGSGLSLWATHPLSVRVAQDSQSLAGGTGPGFASGQQAVAEALRGINAAAGFTVLRPAGASEPQADLTVSWSDALGNALGVARIRSAACPYDQEEGFSCQPVWAEGADIVLAQGAGIAEIQHELLHAVGLSHTCIVPSVMATEFSDDELRWCGLARGGLGFWQPLRLEREIGPHDIAAIEIVRKASAVLKDIRADYMHWLIQKDPRP